MIKKEFEIPIYKVSVLIVQIESANDMEDVEQLCAENEIEVTPSLKENIIYNRKDGGDTYRDLVHRRIVVFFYPFSNLTEKANIICHEKRHIEDRILDYFGVEDIESAALLAGYLGEKFLP